ncbi:MAG: DUF4209 domain-containing protein [Reyranella sp.]
MDSNDPSQNKNPSAQPILPGWLQATLDEIQATDLEAPIAGATASDANILSRLYLAAGIAADEGNDPVKGRVYGMLAAATDMLFRPNHVNEPFKPMMIGIDGRRSPAATDFRGHVDKLVSIAERMTNPVVRARLYDLSWLLERKRASAASAAVTSYLDITSDIQQREPPTLPPGETGVIRHDVQDLLRRALQIGKAIGRDKPETLAARQRGADLMALAFQRQNGFRIWGFGKVDLEFGLTPPATLAAEIENYLALPGRVDEVHNTVGLLELAAAAYRVAKQEPDKTRCELLIADRFESEAAAKSAVPLHSVHFLTQAVAQLNSIPGQKARRKALKHQLIEAQSDVNDDLQSISTPIEVEPRATKVREVFSGKKLIDKLFMLSRIANSPDPADLRDMAEKALRGSILSSVMGTSHIDRDGKVIARTAAAGADGSNNAGAIQHRITQLEDFRRIGEVGSGIEPARTIIAAEHYISDDLLLQLLRHSPFIPRELAVTYSQGFIHFFQGDFTSALYVLTPLLEASLRYVLKNCGHDVTTFDDVTELQEDRTLHSLYGQMRKELDDIFSPAVTTDIENVFIARPGPHLRNRLAHGLLTDGDPYSPNAIYACWLIFTLCIRPLYPQRDQFELIDCD